MSLKQGLINHVAFVLDGSGSMAGKQRDMNAVINSQIEWLARRSTELDQETRVSVYLFDRWDTIQCIVFDKDVLRLPKNLYQVLGGMTALRDATVLSQTDLAKTAQMYGDHAFLTFVLTDGDENNSRNTALQLSHLLTNQPENWTVAVLVPNLKGKLDAISCGFSKGNIEIWDTNSATGVAEVGETFTAALDSYVTGRSTGTRGTKTLFASHVTQAQVDASGMKPIDPSEFVIVPVALASTSTLAYVIPKKSITRKNPSGVKHVEIMPFVEETGRRYVAGRAFYKLTKSEKYDNNKDVVLIHRVTKQVYRGAQAKALIGLDGTSTRVRPQPVKGGDYDIFIQSTSVNRHLEIGGQVLLFHK